MSKTTEEIIEEAKAELKKLVSKPMKTEWPITITFPDGAPFKKAEIFENGDANVWPTLPLQWISLKIKLDDVKE